MKLKPVIVAIGYNRYKSLKRLLYTLNNAHYEEDVTLIISIDFGQNSDVVELAENFQWCHGDKIIRVFQENQGLKKHILQCIDYSVEYGAAVIFEDDIVPSYFFYDYIKQALVAYEGDDRIFALGLYSQIWNGYSNKKFFPVRNGTDAYLTQCECSWGECFIGRQWKKFRGWYDEKKEDLEVREDLPPAVFKWTNSWAKYVAYYIVENGLYFVIPYDSFSTNFHDKGTHTAMDTSIYQVPLMFGRKQYNFAPFEKMVRYDAFFESIDLKEELEKKFHKKICIDCYGTHEKYSDVDFVLSSTQLPYEIVDSYDFSMVQPELNYLYALTGEGLFLYDLRRKKENIPVCTVKKRDKYTVMIKLYSNWISIKQQGRLFSTYLEEKGIKEAAIYGMGDMGHLLYKELSNEGIIIIKYAIDRMAENISAPIAVVKAGGVYENVDAIIVTAVYDFIEIKETLETMVDFQILSLEDIIDSLIKNMSG